MAAQKCQFYMKQKKRNCKFDAKPGELYCGNHLFVGAGQGEMRVPCPVDSRHTIFESELDAHVRKCPGRIQKEVAQARPFYNENIHAGSEDEPELPTVAQGGMSQRRRASAKMLGQATLLVLIKKIEVAYCTWCSGQIPESILLPNNCEPFLKEDHVRPFSLKHAAQQASIIGNMDRLGMLQNAESSVAVEFGAGRGYLSSMLSDVTPIKQFCLIDCGSVRFKADRSMRKSTDVDLQRLTCNIRDLDVCRIPQLREENRPWVACGKHLCGAATDFTLRACHAANAQMGGQQMDERRTGHASIDSDNHVHQMEGASNLRGMAVATCCHHRCSWRSYVGKALFKEAGLQPHEFALMSWMTGQDLVLHAPQRTIKTTAAEKVRQNRREGRKEIREQRRRAQGLSAKPKLGSSCQERSGWK
eukprot:evm.model.scf_153.7 EVM.evm.TU.scf_153.7   scf_153:76933-82022(-)